MRSCRWTWTAASTVPVRTLSGGEQKRLVLEALLRGTDEVLSRTATQVASLEPTAADSTLWVHGAGFASFGQARQGRRSRLAELTRRWEEEHAKLRDLVQTLRTKAAFNDGLASRYAAAQTRLRRFEEAGPPQVMAREQDVPGPPGRRTHRQASRGR